MSGSLQIGAALNSAAFADTGFDGYGTFMEGSNPTVVSSVPTWLIDFDPDFTGTTDKYYVYYPTGYQGYVPLIKSVKFHLTTFKSATIVVVCNTSTYICTIHPTS